MIPQGHHPRAARTARVTTPGTAHRAPVRRAVGMLAALALASGLLTGCGVRLETPPPQPLVPSAAEVVRQRTTADAVALGVLAEQATPGSPEALTALLVRTGEVCQAHLAALGGLYEPFPGAASPTAPAQTPSASPSADDAVPPAGPSPTAPAVTPTDVVALLTETAASARADAATVSDPRMARLLASVSTSRLLLAEAVGAAAGTPPTAAPPFEVPAELPGIAAGDLVMLVQSEDATGLAWEVVAARSADDARATAAERASVHRGRAQSWAELAGADGTGDDPRHSSYDLPAAFTDPATPPEALLAAAAELEGGLAVSYASLVSAADPGARTPLVDALAEESRTQVRLTGVVPAFPGLPEQAG